VIGAASVKSDDRGADGVVRAFQAGYGLVRHYDADFVVKLDCDLDLPSDYF
jgi:hypothetical protein